MTDVEESGNFMMVFFRYFGVRVGHMHGRLTDHAQTADAAQGDFGGDELKALDVNRVSGMGNICLLYTSRCV